MRKIIIPLLFVCSISFGQMFSAQNADADTASNGYFYNWYAVSNSKFAPSGWRVPTNTDFVTLNTYLDTNPGGKMKEVGTTHWLTPNESATNESGLYIFGSGYRKSDGIYESYKIYSLHLSSTESGSNVWAINCYYNNGLFYYGNSIPKKYGGSVRLVKNNSTDPGTLTDYDNNVYTTVVIDTMVWITTNWKCTHLNDGTDIPEVTDNTDWNNLTTGARCVYNNNEGYK